MMVKHETFVCTRTVRAGVATAYRAWSDIAHKSKWFVGPGGVWSEKVREMDFRIGGKETLIGNLKGGGTTHFDSTYMDIVPNERIVYAYRMSASDELLSVSLGTAEFIPTADGCEIRYTEQAVYYNDEMGAENRRMGTEMLMDQMSASLEVTV